MPGGEGLEDVALRPGRYRGEQLVQPYPLDQRQLPVPAHRPGQLHRTEYLRPVGEPAGQRRVVDHRRGGGQRIGAAEHVRQPDRGARRRAGDTDDEQKQYRGKAEAPNLTGRSGRRRGEAPAGGGLHLAPLDPEGFEGVTRY